MFYSENFNKIIVGAYGKKIVLTFLAWSFRDLTASSFGQRVYFLQHLSCVRNSLSKSFIMGLNFQSPSFLMLVNLTIASADVCWGNKCGNNFLYLILIGPLYIKILHPFGNNCFAPSTDLCTLLVLFSVDIPSPSDFLLAMFELFVNYL